MHVPRDGDAKGESASPGAASPAPDADKGAKLSTRKMYYLSCLACRWTSRDVGLPDQTNGMHVFVEFC